MDNLKTIELLKKKLIREKNTRKAAERLLEEKSYELYKAKLQVENSLESVRQQAEKDVQLLHLTSILESMLLNFNARLLQESPNDNLFQKLLDDIVAIENIKAINLTSDLGILTNESLFSGQVFLTADFSVTQSQHQWNKSQTQLMVYIYQEGKKRGSLHVVFHTPPNAAWHNTIETKLCLFADMISAAFQRQLLLDKTIEEKMRAESSEKSTKDFVAMINHELRTPLNGVLGAVELIKETEVNAYQEELLKTVNQAGEMLRVIINDLLDFSKINAGMLELKSTRFSPSELIKSIEQIFSSKVQEQGLDFFTNIDKKMPEYLLGDDDRVKQILVNLIGNAVKFTDKGKISLEANWQDNALLIKVIDNGCGIPKSKQATLFDPFMQVDNSSQRKFEGTGLGLAICKMLVELMDGNIYFTSELNKGTEFTFHLPLQVSSEKMKEEDNKAVSDYPIQQLNILAVEDIKMNQTILGMMLKKLAIKHQFADDGQQALDFLKDNEVDIILMDCRMPILDGFQTTQQLRGQGYTKPIIALTAGTTSMEVEACIDSGMDDILHKPYKGEELKAALAKWGQTLLKNKE
ncbi:hybrid sensor histidine kinase/response regulator [Psychromonas marina]|uniref:histidine kinase n=1 Tax=Psychromonas marina TaxID=88364 RepID=A0ABQ6E3B0_9GAMM|nr:ATP-binding protein [Psychromonas marina]GLS91719.1 hybrid sensor histidine kinase/response regulator [Psychromonas marina]